MADETVKVPEAAVERAHDSWADRHDLRAALEAALDLDGSRTGTPASDRITQALERRWPMLPHGHAVEMAKLATVALLDPEHHV